MQKIELLFNKLKLIMASHILQAYSLANPPPMTFIANNGKGKYLVCLNLSKKNI